MNDEQLVRVELTSSTLMMPLDKAHLLLSLLNDAVPLTYDYGIKGYRRLEYDIWKGMGTIVLVTPAQVAAVELEDPKEA